jgi:hypothetical protein
MRPARVDRLACWLVIAATVLVACEASPGVNEPPASLPPDPFADLPFEMTLPAGWRQGMYEDVTEGALEIAADAVFVAHATDSVDPNYVATLLIFWEQPVVDADAFLSEQQDIFEEGIAASDSPLVASDLRRVALPAGPSLRALFVITEAQVQYYIPTTAGLFRIWFTSPREEIAEREREFDAMAHSFRVREAPS